MSFRTYFDTPVIEDQFINNNFIIIFIYNIYLIIIIYNSAMYKENNSSLKPKQ